MTLSVAQGPERGPALVSQAVEDLRRQRRLGLMLGRTRSRYLKPLPVFHLALSALSKRDPLSAARRVGWRYVVRLGSNEALIDLRGNDPGDLRLQAFRLGARADQLLQAGRLAERAFGRRGDYDTRLLAIPRLRLEGLWLAGAQENLFVFLRGPQQGEIAPFDMVDDARRLARRRRATEPPPDASDLGG